MSLWGAGGSLFLFHGEQMKLGYVEFLGRSG